MRFPYREADILRLANDIAAGLAVHSEHFPAPPFSPDEFQQALAEHDANREAAIQARASAVQSTEKKEQSLSRVQDMATSVIRYAENHTRGDDGQLQLLGWGGRRTPTHAGHRRLDGRRHVGRERDHAQRHVLVLLSALSVAS